MQTVLTEGDSYKIGWIDPEQTIILIQITGTWSWKQAHMVVEQINHLIASTKHDVYPIFEFSPRANNIPPGSVFSQVRKMMGENHDNEPLNIFVGINPLLRKMIDIVSRAYNLCGVHTKYRFVNTLDDALDLIAQNRSSPPSTSEPDVV